MALLGYNINSDTATEGLALTNNSATLRQMGSVYHSLPILLTQEGKSVATRNATTKKIEISTTGRHDYVMFGTTQGLLSVVDAVSGVEKFSFVPSEMIERQVETFKENAGNLSGGKNALYYGMDGEWVAHTVYVTDGSGKLTVQGAVRNVIGSTKDEKENLNGKQWVYGGMRMGGRSYYSLDLTDINTPKLKFHIDPSTGKVYSAAHPEGKDFSAIENMGQSWSKPKLDYVNWKGKRKLVMFVGGGYDAGGNNGDGLWVNGIRTGYEGYENYNYQQDNKRGAGVYMFDADNGDLLWYADANADPDPETPASGSETSTTAATPHLINNDLKYSVVSEIKTVDRNNDGMVDHIYFGDLAGQAFRIDFGRSKDAFTTQGTKILNLHKSDGTSPRFYLSPVFTAHHSSYRKEGADVVVVSFISGNKSSPLLATTDSPVATGQQNSDGLQYDGVYAIYDYDIHPDGFFYPDTHIAARTLAATDASTASTSQLKYISNAALARSDNDDEQVKGAVANADTGWGGWYYRFDKKFNPTSINPDDRDNAGASIIKGLSPLIAMEGNLYVTMYDASNNGTSSSCGAGVKGHSFTQRLCLPTGVCAEDANYIYNLGAGIVSLNVGSVDGGSTKSVVVPDPDDIGVGCRGAACNTNQKFIFAGGDMRFIPNRWYERYAKAN
jgi:type IV pilus assembly protein PilY1